jgi:hypothetical protein
MLLYKYRQFDEYSLENLSRSTLWCSEIEAFNDPYELQFELDIRGGQAELDALYEYWSRRMSNHTFYRRNIRFDAADAIKGSREWWGVCCFSEVPRSPQMWGYYAASHSGFCLGFEFPEHGPEDVITQANIHQVKYLATRPTFPISKFMGDALELKNSLRALLTAKHIDWQHEKEWRFINEEPGQPVQYDPSALKDVLVGTRARVDNVAKLRAICDQLPTKVRFEQLVLVS